MPKKGLNVGAKAWKEYVMKVWKDNPGLSYGQAMKLASKSWKKGGAVAPANPVADGRKYKVMRQGGCACRRKRNGGSFMDILNTAEKYMKDPAKLLDKGLDTAINVAGSSTGKALGEMMLRRALAR